MTVNVLCLHQGSELYGSDRSFLSAVEALASHVTTHCIVPSPGDLAPLLKKSGSTVSYYQFGVLRKKSFRRPLRYLLEMLSAVKHYYKSYKAHDIVYINTTVMFSALIAASIYRGTKKTFFCHVREIPGNRSIFIFKALLRLSGAKLIFNSQATKDAFSLKGEVIYNGVEEIASSAIVSQKNHKTKILLIGRINTWKGQSFFLDSLSSLASEHLSKLDVRIVGSAFEGYEYLETELHQKIEVSRLSGIVSLIPFSTDPIEHYTWADYVVVPSIKPEPFGRVAIEAFSMGLPVIAAGHGGLVEIVGHHNNGFIFEPSCSVALSEVLKGLPHPSSDIYRELSVMALSTYRAKFSLSQYAENIARAVLNRTN